MDCEAGSEESSVSKDFKKPWPAKRAFVMKSPYTSDGDSMSNTKGSYDSEEEDKSALYDIIFNMVDRIIESKQETGWDSNKKPKIDG